MNNLTDQENITEETSKDAFQETKIMGKISSRIDKIAKKLTKFTNDEKKARMIVNLFIFASIVLVLLILGSSLRNIPRRSRRKPQPTPIPLPTISISPTPKPTIKPDQVENLIEDINQVDINQKDLLIPKLDLKISL